MRFGEERQSGKKDEREEDERVDEKTIRTEEENQGHARCNGPRAICTFSHAASSRF